MFSTGQLYFALFFVIVFIAIIIFVYKKDLHQLQKQYKGTFWILLAIVTFIAVLVLLKKVIKL
ncbi:hypothetical protein [Flavobacterium sp.]|uniref:hypothetical protein n=1 Tax=Flavobacterium sp. TaxID=239 RepID=UPI0035277B77